LLVQKHWLLPVDVSQVTPYVFPSLQLLKSVEQKAVPTDFVVFVQPLVGVIDRTHESHASPCVLHASVDALMSPLSLQWRPALGRHAMSAAVSLAHGPSSATRSSLQRDMHLSEHALKDAQKVEQDIALGPEGAGLLVGGSWELLSGLAGLVGAWTVLLDGSCALEGGWLPL